MVGWRHGPSTHIGWLTAIWNSSSRGFNDLFWPLRVVWTCLCACMCVYEVGRGKDRYFSELSVLEKVFRPRDKSFAATLA